MRIPCLAAEAMVTAVMYSGPLSQLIASGLPGHSIRRALSLLFNANLTSISGP